MNFPSFLTPQVIWFLIGLVLLVLELVLPGLIIMFFGLGAWITSLCIILFHPGINLQLIIFIVTSILSLVLLRRYIKTKFFDEDRAKSSALDDDFIGKTAIADEFLKPGIAGRISFKGTTWNAISDVEIEAGEQVKILDKESITLYVTRK
jgi:membrane protein implicated in regulation of membrane protease activity